MVFTCKFYHQLYCSTKLLIFQYIFLIIIYFHSSTQQRPSAAKDVTAKVSSSAAPGRLFFSLALMLSLFFYT